MKETDKNSTNSNCQKIIFFCDLFEMCQNLVFNNKWIITYLGHSATKGVAEMGCEALSLMFTKWLSCVVKGVFKKYKKTPSPDHNSKTKRKMVKLEKSEDQIIIKSDPISSSDTSVFIVFTTRTNVIETLPCTKIVFAHKKSPSNGF